MTYLPNIVSLTLLDNDLLQSVYLNTESNLENISLEKNKFLMDVDFGKQPKLKNIGLGGQIESLGGELPELETLDVSNTKLNTININGAVKLRNLVASNTEIRSLDASSYTSLEVLNLSNCKNFGKDQTNSLLIPNSQILKDIDLTNTSTQSEELGNILSDLNSYSSENDLVKKFRYKGTSRRPYSSDNSIKSLESIGWDIEPKEPPQEKFTQIEVEEKPEITRQDLFEKNEINLLFKDKKRKCVCWWY